MSLASTVASAAMGFRIPSARIIRELDLRAGGAPYSTVWFDGTRLPPGAAARVNAVASDAAASDDSDMRSIAHIGTIVSTVSIALGQQLKAGGADILAAMVVGYEIAGRIDEALTPGRMQRGFHGSVSTVFGGTVAAGRLLELTPLEMAHAIALAATSIGGMAISADTSCGREYHAGASAAAAVQAALAAAGGLHRRAVGSRASARLLDGHGWPGHRGHRARSRCVMGHRDRYGHQADAGRASFSCHGRSGVGRGTYRQGRSEGDQGGLHLVIGAMDEIQGRAAPAQSRGCRAQPLLLRRGLDRRRPFQLAAHGREQDGRSRHCGACRKKSCSIPIRRRCPTAFRIGTAAR